MTPTEIETACREQYNAIGDTFFSQAAIMNLIYRACTNIVQKAPLIERTYTTTGVASQREYDFPANSYAIWRAEYAGVPMKKLTFREDDSINNLTSSITTTGTPRCFSLWNNVFYLRPAPATSGETIKLYTYNFPQVVTIGSTIEIPTMFQPGLIDFVLSEMFAKDGNSNMALYYRKLWSENVLDATKYVNKRKRANGPANVQTEETLITNILGTV